jgi:beta-lactamase regulating signal transducer with metallopeptidase domain
VDRLLEIGFINALTATALALPVAAISRLLRRPPLTRALWILVLLKLITPPVWSVPLWQHAPAVAGVATTPPAEFAPAGDQPQFDDPDSVTDTSQPADVTETKQPATFAIPAWSSIATAVWLIGSVIYLLLILISLGRISRLIRRSLPAPCAVQVKIEALSRAIGLRHPPSVGFIDGLAPPMLCAIGTGPRILLPVRLWDRLDDRQRDTVLAHELAHLRRRDHWTRALELLVGVVYWWHPLFWWSRYELREAAEQCCDAWVVWSMPRLARSYAAALVEAIEFISSAPAAVPALASTMGQFTDLRRRLVMIKQGNAMRSLTRPTMAAIFSAAGFLLPLSPSFGQEAAPDAPVAPRAPIVVAPFPTPAEASQQAAIALAPVAPIPDEQADPAARKRNLYRSADEADPTSNTNRNANRAEYEKARAEVASLRAQLRAAEKRLAALEKGDRGDRGNRKTQPTYRSVMPPKPKTPDVPAYPPMPKGLTQQQNDAFSRASDRLRAAGDQLNEARDRSRQALERRLDAMERQMNEVSNQLRQLRRQLSERPNPEPRPQGY